MLGYDNLMLWPLWFMMHWSVLCALLLHGFLLGLFLWVEHGSELKKTVSYTWITAELVFQSRIISKQPAQSKKQLHFKNHTILDTVVNPVVKPRGRYDDSRVERDDDELRQLLNRKIQENLFYPTLAQKLNQTGVATISFWLNTTGEISQPKVEVSTTIAMLDAAALKTVQTINPVEEAKQWLGQKEQFVVDIHFEY